MMSNQDNTLSMLYGPNEKNWREWVGPLEQEPPSKKDLEMARRAEAEKKNEERRRQKLDIQSGVISRSAGELLDAVND